MSKKIFSLFKGKSIHLTSGKKVIPKEDVAEFLTLQELLDKIKEEEKQYRKEVEEECNKLKEKAIKEGEEKGFEQWTKQLTELEKQAQEIEKKYQKSLAAIALKATQKIVGKQLKTSKKTVTSIVENALEEVTHHKKICIWVNPKDLEQVSADKEQLKSSLSALKTFAIKTRDDITPGGCIIETEMGIVNATLENQWKNLEALFNAHLTKE